VPIALGVVLVLYLAVGATVLLVLGVSGTARSERPLTAVAEAVNADWLVPVVTAAAGVAALAALLALVAGVSRTVFAMADEGDLPRLLATVHPTRRVPHRAEAAVGACVIVAVLAGGLVAALSFSAFAVLLYYAVANAAAWKLHGEERRFPRWLAVAGLASCLLLAASLPLETVLRGIVALTVVMALRAIVRSRAGRPRS
jgi:APA family basic amino acid/polyamine antiporter